MIRTGRVVEAKDGSLKVCFDRPENTQDLTCEEKGNLIKAVVNYACGREYEHLDTGTVSIV